MTDDLMSQDSSDGHSSEEGIDAFGMFDNLGGSDDESGEEKPEKEVKPEKEAVVEKEDTAEKEAVAQKEVEPKSSKKNIKKSTKRKTSEGAESVAKKGKKKSSKKPAVKRPGARKSRRIKKNKEVKLAKEKASAKRRAKIKKEVKVKVEGGKRKRSATKKRKGKGASANNPIIVTEVALNKPVKVTFSAKQYFGKTKYEKMLEKQKPTKKGNKKLPQRMVAKAKADFFLNLGGSLISLAPLTRFVHGVSQKYERTLIAMDKSLGKQPVHFTRRIIEQIQRQTQNFIQDLAKEIKTIIQNDPGTRESTRKTDVIEACRKIFPDYVICK